MTNLLTGLLLFFEVAGDTPLSVAQVSVMGSLMLIGHSLPVEGAIAHRAGVPWSVTIALRVGGALFLGFVLHLLYTVTDTLQQTASYPWKLNPRSDALIDWLLSQLQALAMIFFVIFFLLVLIRTLQNLGIERLIHLAFAPLLKLLGIGKEATNIIVIGVFLGLTYGAGLSHSMIEDTIMILVLGADLSGVLWARIVFAILAITLLARCLPHKDHK